MINITPKQVNIRHWSGIQIAKPIPAISGINKRKSGTLCQIWLLWVLKPSLPSFEKTYTINNCTQSKYIPMRNHESCNKSKKIDLRVPFGLVGPPSFGEDDQHRQ